ncbi:MAG: gliding motility-associated C-terminal domain-containing protein [Chitinophagaceae bacterium]|nr:gliding motility-associated C-terminal domain-containing protein [Chitinophagaceae bacterium]
MRKLLLIILFLNFSTAVIARHIAGGELFYEYLGPSNFPNTSVYRISLRLFRDCQSTGPILENENVTVGIYENDALKLPLGLKMEGSVRTIQLNTQSFPCLTGSPVVCYQIAIFTNTVELADNPSGYTLSRTGCCRVDGITSLGGARNIGSNYMTQIPGTRSLAVGHNSSPQFNVRDTALVCTNKKFVLDFGANDVDNDSLSYSFCEAFGASAGSNNAPPADQLSLMPLNYSFPFSGSSPLGPNVTINQGTGIISGTAPSSGSYVVNVCITEWRNRIPFSTHRKDFILKVQDCDLIAADLPDKIIQCDSMTVHFENQNFSSGITSYLWDFGIPNAPDNFSTQPYSDHKYADTGRYKARLQVTGPRGCIGIDSTIVLVYPGFFPKMKITGSCLQKPYQFTDISTAAYGFISSRLWDLGDEASTTDTSTLQQFTYKFNAPATRVIQLVVESSKGCIDSIVQTLLIRSKPVLTLPFRDTLICSIDTLLLGVEGTGNFSWTPNSNIINANTESPQVFPKTTTKYFVTVNDQGCVGSDSVTVNVLSFITVKLGIDSSICKTDSFHLHPVSEGLAYHWMTSTGEQLPNDKYPLVKPLQTTQYKVFANLGKCIAEDSVLIKVVPYPIANAGQDTGICFGNRITLNANISGSTFSWTGSTSLLNANSLHPIAGPYKTTAYILTVSDTLGCSKQVSDTIIISIIPPINANAGNDTSIVLGQPLQLNAKGGISYAWTPVIGLTNPNIANPIAILEPSVDSITYKVTVTGEAGCFAIDDIKVKLYKSGPEIFVPTAFTPNADNKNDILRPITVGIAQLHYFNIYNRWGQLLYSSSEMGKGWDGTINGGKAPSGTYVFIAEGIDYLGKLVYRKGTTVLIR